MDKKLEVPVAERSLVLVGAGFMSVCSILILIILLNFMPSVARVSNVSTRPFFLSPAVKDIIRLDSRLTRHMTGCIVL